ncbi:VOC family protein [Roseateles amylovorans]|uniref:VOC family protein n=1 Tax=Roseateles amylovorans TaxID=2978473 RepID=A0ABY6B140_9BURK|nr:VOC family protein [Roseateles amylovorans]UXH77253.1 VOC family protein [Roseateles amylovorans]
MQVQRIDHFTLRTPHLAQTLAFYESVVGLTPGPRPAFGFPGAWLYAQGRPILHLAELVPGANEALTRYLGDPAVRPGGGTVDHIALRCTDLPALEQRLRRLSVHYEARTVPALGEHQLFVIDPNEVRIEFIFDAAEPASWHTDAEGVSLTTSATAAKVGA